MHKDYSIKTEKFEGPLDVLLEMIEKRKLLINDFSLSQIADDFINYVSTLGQASAQKISDFLVIASTLILIKSRSLLPTLLMEESEEKDIKDLETRLNILKIIKDISLFVEEKYQQIIRFPRKITKKLKPKFTPNNDLNPHSLRIIMLGVINTFPKFEEKKEARIKKVISLEDTMNKLINRVKTKLSMSFFEFSGKKSKTEKINILVSFLAVLELVKRGLLTAKQTDKYNDINLESKEVNTPTFEI